MDLVPPAPSSPDPVPAPHSTTPAAAPALGPVPAPSASGVAPSPLPALAHFLRSRRARLTPESVGLPRSGVRRLPGLRRAEVAVLAGISPEYYTRLEQGRQRHPSAEVLDALASALRLDADARRHLHRLTVRAARRTGPGDGPAGDCSPVPGATLRLLRATTVWPAYVISPVRDVLAWNDAAVRLITDFAALPVAHRNLAWFAYGDPRARELFVDWDAVARGNAHRLRDALAADPHDARGNRLVAELTAHSQEFAAAWEDHDVRGPGTGHKDLDHPSAGRLRLDYTVYVIPGARALELVVMTAPEGSPSHRALVRSAGSGPG
ncbi:helix-turn-helix domain-containing protein [Streptomyces sp. NPDC079020]|uniref:helix-turn-helix domain-containing protein n=1 Tax=Streptomyces sp. NPDC079020 TaxID=3365722 RepID=UPI0037D7A489